MCLWEAGAELEGTDKDFRWAARRGAGSTVLIIRAWQKLSAGFSFFPWSWRWLQKDIKWPQVGRRQILEGEKQVVLFEVKMIWRGSNVMGTRDWRGGGTTWKGMGFCSSNVFSQVWVGLASWTKNWNLSLGREQTVCEFRCQIIMISECVWGWGRRILPKGNLPRELLYWCEASVSQVFGGFH